MSEGAVVSLEFRVCCEWGTAEQVMDVVGRAVLDSGLDVSIDVQVEQVTFPQELQKQMYKAADERRKRLAKPEGEE